MVLSSAVALAGTQLAAWSPPRGSLCRTLCCRGSSPISPGPARPSPKRRAA